MGTKNRSRNHSLGKVRKSQASSTSNSRVPARNLSVSTSNSRVPARNLSVKELGAVIFGCKHHTYDECVKSKLFGLPAGHYSYVRNIRPGLALFLFNYSDRTLHGLYEAASYGQRNIKPHAWTTAEGTETTPFEAQVQINLGRQCRPLREEVFKPIIAKNYYKNNFFWFELDVEQADQLTTLFLSAPLPLNPRSIAIQTHIIEAPKPGNETLGRSYASVVSSSCASAASNNTSDALAVSNSTSDASVVSNSTNDAFVDSTNDAFVVVNSTNDSHVVSNTNDTDAPQKKWAELFKASSSASSHDVSQIPQEACTETRDSPIRVSWEELADTDSDAITEDKAKYEKDHEKYYDFQDSEFESVVARESAEAVLSGESESSHGHSFQPNLQLGVLANNVYSAIEPVLMDLMYEIKGMKMSQFVQSQKINSLESELVESKLEIDRLKKQYKQLESTLSYAGIEDGSEYLNLTLGTSLVIVGGYNGITWTQDVNLYSPSEDRFNSLCSWTFPRSYAALSYLNNELYLFGGVHQGVWCDTVESYNPVSNQWMQRPSLNQKKGSLAGASMEGKIYAVGGGNGVECLSEVEFFDLDIGRWIATRSMLEKRLGPGIVEIDGALYVTGGYDGKDYLRSVERFDPRERSWSSLQSMNSRRGGHCMAACNGKLYAMGGYDGSRMVSSSEVYDPRVDFWVTREPMSTSRGYFGSFVDDGKVYVVGGVDERDDVLDLVEWYEEGSGWQRSAKSSALGRRCFFSSCFGNN